MTRLPMVLVLVLFSTAAAAAERVALLPFELINTSLEPTRPDETARLEGLNAIAAKRRAKPAMRSWIRPRWQTSSPRSAPYAAAMAAIWRWGRDLGADYVAVGWVQKVSNLILNINLAVRDVATASCRRRHRRHPRQHGRILAARRSYLLDHRILPQPASPP